MPTNHDGDDRGQFVGSADLVLAGGGVKGIGLVGALEVLNEHGYTNFRRVAGTSVGAIVGALVAAGMSISTIADELLAFEFPKFRDTDWLDRVPGVGRTAGLIKDHGIYEGDAVTDWIGGLLARHDVATFGDLRNKAGRRNGLNPPRDWCPLVVFATDVTLGRLVRLPDDYHLVYGLNRDEQPVAHAVRASMSIPYFFEPVKLGGSLLVDGAVLSNYAIDAFDTEDPAAARWPTFGMTLMDFVGEPVTLGKDLARGIMPALRFLPRQLTGFHEDLIGTVIAGQDRHAIERRGVKERTIEIDANKFGIVDFDISPEGKAELIQQGRAAATEFMKRWDGNDGRAHAGTFPLPVKRRLKRLTVVR